MKKCYTRLYLFLPLFIFCFALLKYSNVNAATTVNIPTVLYAIVNRSLNGAAFSNASTITTATNTPATVATMGNFTSYFAKTLSVSARLPQSAAGASVTFHLSGDLGYNGASLNAFTSNLRGGLTGYIRPEQGTITNYSDSYNFYGVDVNGGSDINTIHFIIDSNVSLQSSTEISSFVFTLTNPDNYVLSCSNQAGSMSKPCSNGDYYYVNNLRLTYDIAIDPTYAQNQTIINQNQQIIDNQNAAAQQDQEDRDNISDTAQNAQDSADSAQDQNEQATSSLLDTMGSLFTALGTPATDCKVNADLGNIDLGEIDYCSGKPAAFEPIINSVCIMIMAIPIYLIARDLMLRFIYLTSYAQGGDNVR